MKLFVLLDFDGVLFNSAYEAYQVCENLSKASPNLRRGIHFDEFMEFRAYLTDAWQFHLLYSKNRQIQDYSQLQNIQKKPDDILFADQFFQVRKQIMEKADWAKIMAPYPFFYQIRDLMNQHPKVFKILSTRDKDSIAKTLSFYSVSDIEIYGQESIQRFGSKLETIKSLNLLQSNHFVVYIDDMHGHLEPFLDQVNLSMHANWGYDKKVHDSYSQTQAFNVIESLTMLATSKND